jgi:3-oxoacyl-[acyl-carrier protein] reductase
MVFNNKVAIVTGASREIGAAIATRLAQDGCAIFLCHCAEAELAEAHAMNIRANGSKVIVHEADLSTVETNTEMIARCVKDFGRLDFLIANAGITVFKDFIETDESTFNKLFDLNVKGSFFGAQAAAKQMILQGQGGRILFSSSVTGIRAAPGLSAYSITKAALRHMALSLATELGKHKITVNALGIGAVLNERNLKQDPNYAETWGDWNPIGRVLYPNDVANAVRFLVSDEAESITGQTIVVDGGWSFGGKMA